LFVAQGPQNLLIGIRKMVQDRMLPFLSKDGRDMELALVNSMPSPASRNNGSIALLGHDFRSSFFNIEMVGNDGIKQRI
jgi:hypothetical protein